MHCGASAVHAAKQLFEEIAESAGIVCVAAEIAPAVVVAIVETTEIVVAGLVFAALRLVFIGRFPLLAVFIIFFDSFGNLYSKLLNGLLAIPLYQYISGNCDTETKQPIDADCKVPATML